MTLQAGHSFGNYRIVQLIGEGGFGEVYLAENPLLERRAAVKVLHTGMASDQALVKRFLNEARAVSAIRHPNIIEVFDAGLTPEGNPYILMEFLDGCSLQKHLTERGRLTFQELLPIAQQGGSALAAAHKAGIVHRDLKPENIFLTTDSLGQEVIKILDFGIAKIKRGGGVSGTHGTQSGLIMGSPAYMSPEQCKDSADVDLRSDIYSLGVIFYEVLTGNTPFMAATGTEMLVMHLTAPVPPLADHLPIPPFAREALMCALAKDRNQRFDNVTSFVDAFIGVAPLQATAPIVLQTGSGMVKPTRAVTVTSSSVTTFSQSKGELQPDEFEAPMPTSRSQRLPIVIGAGVALVGLAIFAYTRLSQPSETTAEPTVAAAAQPSLTPPPTAAPAPPPVPAIAPPMPDAGLLPVANVPAAATQPSEVVKPVKSKTRGRVSRKSDDDEWAVH